MSIISMAARALQGLHDTAALKGGQQWIQPPLITDEDLRNAKITVHEGACPMCVDEDWEEPQEDPYENSEQLSLHESDCQYCRDEDGV